MKTWQSKTFNLLTVILLSSQLLPFASIAQGEETDTVNEGTAETIPLQLLGINDFHGSLDTTGTAYLGDNKFEKVGKAANLATHLDAAEQAFKTNNANGATERIQAGDLVGGSPANSTLLQHESTIKVLNRMKFTLGTLGNHEFDQGLAEFDRIMNGIAPEPGKFNPIVDNYPREASNMEIVVGNVVNKSDGKIPNGYKPYTVRTYGEGEQAVKVGYIGVITTEFPNLVLKQHHENFNVLDEAETIVKYSKELRSQGVEAIVVISHVAATSSGETVQGDAKTIMDKVNGLDAKHSVDVFFAAHNHQYTNGLIKYSEGDVRVVQSTSNGKAYIDLQAELDVATQDFATIEATVKPTTSELGEDPAVKEIVDHANQTIKQVTESKLATADNAAVAAGKIGKDYNAHSESPLGNLVVDAQLYMANQAGLTDAAGKPLKVDFALTNNGGIRDDLRINANGDITWGAAQAVQPFGNILQVVEIAGKDLKGALGEQHQNGKLHYFLQIAGLKMTYTGVGDNFVVKTVTDSQGKPIEDNKKYNIVINDFLLGGGDGFKSFTQGKLITAMDTDTNTFIDYFKAMATKGQQISIPTGERKAEHTDEIIPLVLELDELAKALEEVKSYQEKNYPAAAWQEFVVVRGQAEDVYKRALAQNEVNSPSTRNVALSQVDIDKTTADLNQAKATLNETYTLNLTELKETLAKVSTKKEADYTPESWKPFMAAKTEAEDVLKAAEAEDSKVTQALVDNTLVKLTEADKALVPVKKVIDDKSKNKNNGILPKTGTKDNLQMFALGSIITATSLVFVIKRRKAVK